MVSAVGRYPNPGHPLGVHLGLSTRPVGVHHGDELTHVLLADDLDGGIPANDEAVLCTWWHDGNRAWATPSSLPIEDKLDLTIEHADGDRPR